jgi:hypothetical protein
MMTAGHGNIYMWSCRCQRLNYFGRFVLLEQAAAISTFNHQRLRRLWRKKSESTECSKI